jgi:hypothetical protein
MWRISLLSLALFVVTRNGVAYSRASPTVFHTGDPAKSVASSKKVVPARRGLMGRLLVSLALLGLMAGTSPALAKGGPLHLFESQRQPVVRAGAPTLSLPPPGEFLAGCGRGRHRDQATQKCRGPADVGR